MLKSEAFRNSVTADQRMYTKHTNTFVKRSGQFFQQILISMGRDVRVSLYFPSVFFRNGTYAFRHAKA